MDHCLEDALDLSIVESTGKNKTQDVTCNEREMKLDKFLSSGKNGIFTDHLLWPRFPST